MIRKFETQDLDAVMQIWLQANLDAHAFIPASFWEAHFEMVRDMLPQAELYVHENEAPRQIDGFIGLTENHIEGIFVAKSARSKGIGKALLEYAKSAAAGIRSRKNICHRLQTAGQAFTACPAVFLSGFLKVFSLSMAAQSLSCCL